MRKSEITRKTAETDISLSLNLDGAGTSDINTGVGFLDHMLTLFARHGRFDLALKCTGDTHVDNHHSVEDIGICLGEVFAQALGERRGIRRYGDITLPMDEALVLCAVDVSGRGFLSFDVPLLPDYVVGTFETELFEEFLLAFARKAGITVHLKLLDGKNTHHIIEACFKALARALGTAVSIDDKQRDEIPSTKGTLI
jgi:imidazoleglycerol-phosphate dehydratase